MITIISGTNRPDSSTLKVAKAYKDLMENEGIQTKFLSLESLPVDIAFSELYGKRTGGFKKLLDEFIEPSSKFVIIAPEYNGSFPGILKTFIDAVHPDLWRGKKVGLVGVSSGRAGNLRGMEHLTGVLNYLGLYVHPNRQPVSSIEKLMDKSGHIHDEITIKVLKKHINDIISW